MWPIYNDQLQGPKVVLHASYDFSVEIFTSYYSYGELLHIDGLYKRMGGSSTI